MPLGMDLGLGPGHIVLDGDPAPPPAPKNGPSSPYFSAHVYCGQTIVHLSSCWALVLLFHHGTATVASVVNEFDCREVITLSVHVCLQHVVVTQNVRRQPMLMKSSYTLRLKTTLYLAWSKGWSNKRKARPTTLLRRYLFIYLLCVLCCRPTCLVAVIHSGSPSFHQYEWYWSGLFPMRKYSLCLMSNI